VALHNFFCCWQQSELHIANTLHRHFWWYENVLWLEDLPPHLQPTSTFIVVLAADDDIINVPLVKRYIDKQDFGSVVVIPGVGHAELLAWASTTAVCLDAVERAHDTTV
jgi:hypothetical protein